jgi:hypothetical protein
MIDVVVFFFLLGVAARLVKSDLRLPEALYETLSIYLLLAIGLKGGIELSKQPLAALAPQVLACAALGFVIPFVLFPLLRALRLNGADAAAVAAHYGSVSVVTFAVATAALARQGIAHESHAALWVAVMEAPGLVAGILLARWSERRSAEAAGAVAAAAGVGWRDPARAPVAPAADALPAPSAPPAPLARWRELAHDVLFGKSVLLLLGGLAIGAIAGEAGTAPIHAVFVEPFKGVLALFLLELGLVAGARLAEVRRFGVAVLVVGLAVPPLLALAGLATGVALGLSTGGVALLATLAASASYIAAPTAMRIAVPEANAALSITAALGITFPFNIVAGIPLYIALAQQLTAGAA